MVMMSRWVRRSVLVALALGSAAGCAHTDTSTADPETEALASPAIPAEDPPSAEDPPAPDPGADPGADPDADPVDPTALAQDPDTEVITFADEDADPGMSDVVTAPPKREPLPSMMSDVLHGPNK